MAKIKMSAVKERAFEIWNKSRDMKISNATRMAMKEMQIPDKYFMELNGSVSMEIKNYLDEEAEEIRRKQQEEEDERKRKEAEAKGGGETPKDEEAGEEPPKPPPAPGVGQPTGPNVTLVGIDKPISGILKNFAPKTYMWMWYQFAKSMGINLSFEDYLEVALHNYYRDRHLSLAVVDLRLLASLTQEQAKLIFPIEPLYGDVEKQQGEAPEIRIAPIKQEGQEKKPEAKVAKATKA